jgi:hypothetical protein
MNYFQGEGDVEGTAMLIASAVEFLLRARQLRPTRTSTCPQCAAHAADSTERTRPGERVLNANDLDGVDEALY